MSTFTATRSASMQGRQPRSRHIVRSTRGKSGEIQQLWTELYRLASMLEGKVVAPYVERVSVSEISRGAGSTSFVIEGRDFIPPGWTQARVNIDTGVAHSGIDWIAVQPGEDGNEISVEYVTGATLSVAYDSTTRKVTVTLASGGSTANAIISAVAASSSVAAVVQPENEFGSTGAGTITSAVAATKLTGGTGEALRRAYLDLGGIRYEARVPGPAGNLISVAYTAGAAGAAPVVTVSGHAISISIDVGTTTYAQVIDAFNQSVAARLLASARLTYATDGATAITGTVAATKLAGGDNGTAVRFTVGGLAGTITKITDTEINASVGQITASVSGEMVLVELDVCGLVNQWQAKVIV